MKNKSIYISAAVCLIAVIGMILALCITSGKSRQAEFTPPPFEQAAQSGMPVVSDESYTKVYQDGMSFTAYVCGKVSINGNSADLYFTNDKENEVWMKLHITDENGKILAETGLLNPNEYVQTVDFGKVPVDGTKIKLKIMAYEPETYYSAGAVTLNTTIGG